MDNERPDFEVETTINGQAVAGMEAPSSQPFQSAGGQPTAIGIESSSSSIPLAIVGGVVAAIVTGVIWAMIVVVTDYEVGFAALGVGFLCGLATILFGRGSGVPFQVIAVITSMIGIIIGKYGMYYYYLKEFIVDEYGEEALAEISIFSGAVISDFTTMIGSMLSGYDILWVVLAVTMAWKTAGAKGEAAEE